MQLPVLARAFDQEPRYSQRAGTEYALLPFRFLPLDGERYILTNFAGQYVILDRPTLESFARHKLKPETPIYDELKARHFLMDEDSNVAIDLLANQYRTRHALLPQMTGLFLFVVTLRCEHSCPYCQVSRQAHDRNAFDMKIAHAEKAIEIMFETPSPRIKVEFQGGEPLLNFELIQWIVKRVRQINELHGKDIAFVIATNLALVTDEILGFCKEFGIDISTSLDGPRELHNTNRPRPGGDSYEKTIEGIHLARKYLGHDRVSALMTTTERSLSQVEAIIDEYVEQGFPSIFLRSLSPFGFAIKTGAVNRYSSDEWISFYKRGLSHILSLNARGIVFQESYAALLLRKILTPYPIGYVDLQSPMGMGLGCLVFNYDGTIYGSDEARMVAEMKDTSFQLGHVDHDCFHTLLTSDRYFNWLTSTMTESVPQCADCGVQPFCGCDPLYHYATQGDVVGNKATSGFCHKNMEIIRHLIRLLEDDPASAKVLKSWIH